MMILAMMEVMTKMVEYYGDDCDVELTLVLMLVSVVMLMRR